MSSHKRLYAALHARVGNLQLNVELAADAGPLIVVGPNGAGKTSLLLLLLGALSPSRGRIDVSGTTLLDTDSRLSLPVEERALGYLPQDYALFPHLSVRENVEFALASSKRTSHRVQRRQRAEGILRELGLGAHSERRIDFLSGGEKQRVGLARALSVEPRALLLDEPLAALDVHARSEVRAFMAGYLARLGVPSIVVTHDASDARALGTELLVLESGRVTQTGTWPELCANPASPFVEAFVRSSSTD